MESSLSPRQQVLFELLGYDPTGAQETVLRDDIRFQLITGGIQSGKSVLAGVQIPMRLPADYMRAKEEGWGTPLIYWFVAADYGRTSQEFNYLRQHIEAMGLLDYASPNVNPGTMKIRATPDPKSPIIAIVRTKSAADITTLSQESPMGIVVCEASQISLEAYWRVQERCGPRKAWVFMAGTMEGSLGWYPSLHDQWKWDGDATTAAYELPSYSNTYLFKGGRNDPEIMRWEKEFDPDFFKERVEGVPCPPAGLVFKEFRPELHIQDVAYEAGYPVNLWIDPGTRRSGAVMVAQVYGEGTDEVEVRIVDEVYTQDLIDEEIIDMCMARPWWKDVANGQHAVDKYATQRHGRAPIAETWSKIAHVTLNSHQVKDVNDGTARMKAFLKVNPVTRRPKMVISTKCPGFLSELGYCLNPIDNMKHVYSWKMGQNGETEGTKPVDKYNDCCKAVIYGLIDRFGHVGVGGTQVRKVQRFNSGKKRRTRRT